MVKTKVSTYINCYSLNMQQKTVLYYFVIRKSNNIKKMLKIHVHHYLQLQRIATIAVVLVVWTGWS